MKSCSWLAIRLLQLDLNGTNALTTTFSRFSHHLMQQLPAFLLLAGAVYTRLSKTFASKRGGLMIEGHLLGNWK